MSTNHKHKNNPQLDCMKYVWNAWQVWSADNMEERLGEQVSNVKHPPPREREKRDSERRT